MAKASVKFRIESKAIASLTAKLAALDRKVARKALRDGINDATKIVLADAKARVPKRTGQLRKSLGRKVKVYRGGKAIVGIVGPRKGFRILYLGKPIDPVKYAHLVEYGRREVVPKKKKVLSSGKGKGGVVYGTRVRMVPPHPFLRPAWEENRTRVVGLIIQRLHAAIKAFYGRARGRAAMAA